MLAAPVREVPAAGELALVDTLTLHGGGGAFNVSTRLARWGLAVEVAGKVGTDAFGDFLLGQLDDRAVGRRGVVRDPGAPTSASVVLVDPAGERSFLHLLGANGALRLEELDPEILYAGRCLLFTGALVMPALDGAPAARMLADARRRGIVTALDTVWDPTGAWERVVPALPHVDVFLPSLAEARAITGQHEYEAVAGALHARGVVEVLLKLGRHGCYASGPGFAGAIDPVEVETVDETGAGDAFVAGFLYGRLAGWSFEQSARFANAAGAVAATAIGAAEGLAGVDEILRRVS